MRRSSSLSRESQFLLACVKLEPTRQDLHWVEQELGHPTLKWNRVVDLAYQQDVAPLIYNTLSRFDTSVVNCTSALRRLRAAYYVNAVRNTLLFQELQNILRTLGRRGRAAIVLKGAALAETVYPNRALRPMSDLDLLIHKEELVDVEELFAELDYVLDEKQLKMKEWYDTHYHHLAFHKVLAPSLTLRCEIHWSLERPTRPFPIDIDGIWKRAVPATIADIQALVLSPEDLLVHLCLHTCKHRLTGGFRAFCDIAETIRHFGQDMDWKQIHARASEWRINTFVYVPLRLAQMLLGAQVPEWVMNALEPGDFDNRLLDAATAAVLEDRVSAALFPAFFQLRQGKSLRKRATTMLKRVFSHTAIAGRYALSPTSKKIYCHYPRRLKDTILEYGLELWRFVRLGRGVVAKAEGYSKLEEWLAPFDSAPPP